jgi:diadenosine tetraphosphate (Ap4A) HIT family hydrolase
VTAGRSDCLFCRIVVDAVDRPERIHDFAHSVALVSLDQTHRGRCLLLMREHYEDTLEIPDPLYRAFNDELRVLARAVRAAFDPPRLNYLNYGNVEPHVHVHIIPRYPDEPGWGGPPAAAADAATCTPEAQAQIAAAIRARIADV